MKLIDFKSLLIGILGTALVMVLMGVAHSKGNYQTSCTGVRCMVLNTMTGVYKIAVIGGFILSEENFHPDSVTPDF